jgi:DNA-nicking Smr family endonuclease
MKKNKKKEKAIDKNKIPVFDSDQDLIEAFERKTKKPRDSERRSDPTGENRQKNRHGISVLDTDYHPESPEDEAPEDFETLLEASFKKSRIATRSNRDKPAFPIKKRLKRYPGVEKTLDLHGYNALGAQIQAESFISSCKQQGYFTVRIIVGKGKHSQEGPVLPDVVEDVVKQMKKKEQVLSYSWEKKSKTHSGAIIIYLKQFEQYD